MAANTAQEQLMLELVNRARMNPSGEATRQGIDLNQGLAPGTISTAPKQVLAMNDLLVVAADKHSKWMHLNDQFSHEEPASFPMGRTGLNPDNRMTAAGYVFAGPLISSGENISFTGTTGTVNPTTAIIEQHRSLFLSPGHRENILEDGFREIGIGQELGTFFQNGTNFNASMVTQNFALSGTKVFVTGVVYNDTSVADDFFSVGEQTVGRPVTGPGIGDTTGAGGGYELGFATTGDKTISFALATGLVQVAVTVGTVNIKVDIVSGKEVWTNSDIAVLGSNVTEIHALGILPIELAGGAGSEKIFGNNVANTLRGGAGNDILNGGGSADRMFGQAGADTYIVDHSLDTVDETGGDAAADGVQSSIGFSLVNSARVLGALENLILTGTAAIGGVGNALANVLTGNTAGNVLSGGAGNDTIRGHLGNDTLTGGANNDSFTFNTAPNYSTNRDVVTDFTHGVDKFWMENAIFTKLGAAGVLLNPAFLRVGAAAVDANDFIVYNKATGGLFYDSNANAAGGLLAVAVLINKPLLSASDFAVI